MLIKSSLFLFKNGVVDLILIFKVTITYYSEEEEEDGAEEKVFGEEEEAEEERAKVEE